MTHAQQFKTPFVVGVIGGIASGKSQVTRILGALNATIISADEIAHRVLLEPEVIDLLLKIFGKNILIENGDHPGLSRAIDRKKLASLVFGDSADSQTMRKKLEAIVHPRIRQIAKSELDTLKQDTSMQLIILDAPLLIEGGWLPYCDRVIYLESPEAMRKQRAMERGWSAQEWQDRELAQLSLSEKKKHATDVLVNDGTIQQLTQRVLELNGSWQN